MFGLQMIARAFQAAGINVLLYDPRATGESGVHHMHPEQHVEDMSDALTFLLQQLRVESTHIGLWGVSFSGAIAWSCALRDPRAQFVIYACPVTELHYSTEKTLHLVTTAVFDREAQKIGSTPMEVAIVTEHPAWLQMPLSAPSIREVLNDPCPREGEDQFSGGPKVSLQSYARAVRWLVGQQQIHEAIQSSTGLCDSDRRSAKDLLRDQRRPVPLLVVAQGKDPSTFAEDETYSGLHSQQIGFIKYVIENV